MITLNIGTKVRIKSLDWYQVNRLWDDAGYFTKEMTCFCDTEAIITNIKYKFADNRDILCYKLNIDNGKYDWQDYMFNLEELFLRLINSYCTYKCNFNCCIKSECPIFNIKGKNGYDIFNVGDKIKLKPIKWFGYHYNTFAALTEEMTTYGGKEATITDIIEDRCIVRSNIYSFKKYFLDIDNRRYFWKDFMIELPRIDKDIIEFCNYGCIHGNCNKCFLKYISYR